MRGLGGANSYTKCNRSPNEYGDLQTR